LKIFREKNNTENIFRFWFNGFNKLKSIIDMKYNIIGICSLISIEQKDQEKLIIDNMKQILENIFLITKKINKKIEDNENKDEEVEQNEDEEHEENEDKIKKVLGKIIHGEYNSNEKDESISYEEMDEDDLALTNFEKQSPILFVKNTLNYISQKSPDIYKLINETLKEHIQELNYIFETEQKRMEKK
jgi:hypothetical protein